MDKLKNFIDANRDAFEEDEMLPEGHFERFEQKLPKPRKNRAALYSLSAFVIAASIALLLLFRLPGGTGLPEPAKDHGPDLRDPRGDRGTTSILQYANERGIDADEEVV